MSGSQYDRGSRREEYAEDYDRIRDTMSAVLNGFEDFNRRVRLPLGFRIRQAARELIFLTPSGRAEFSTAPLPDVVPAPGRLTLATVRSHDQWNTTIYSNDDRYRGVKNLRTLVFMKRRRHARARHRRARPGGHHQHRQGRQHQVRPWLPGHPVRHPARLRHGLHAGDERAVRGSRLQRAKRPTPHELLKIEIVPAKPAEGSP
ncbi:hypothetical protein [Planotetraspora sp. GP83]|uniref:hypothetical protein n=1 Tax=Planotetraspora sp. GP83 TaxID=3156264 RepID=UPI0035119220